jgi:hypothetical protein
MPFSGWANGRERHQDKGASPGRSFTFGAIAVRRQHPVRLPPNSAAHCPLKASHGIPSKLIDPVTTDTPFRRDRFDVVFGDHMRQRIELTITVKLTLRHMAYLLSPQMPG